MTNYSDEELQNRIIHQQSTENTPDATAYRKVFESLKHEPYHLPLDFADNVIINVKANKVSFSKDYFWCGAGLLVFIAAALLTSMFSNLTIDFSVFRFLNGYASLFVFGAALIALVQYLDKVLVRKKLSNR